MANANDPFDCVNVQTLLDPSDDIYPVTPDDANDLPVAARALRATGAGNIVVVMRVGITRTLAFTAGETRHGRFIRVKATSTTATGIEAHI